MTLSDLYTVAALGLLAGLCYAINLKTSRQPTTTISFLMMWAAVAGIVATIVIAVLGLEPPGGAR